MRHLVLIALLLFADVAVAENNVWQLSDWGGPTIDVWTYEPPTATKDTPVVIVMHGWSRDVERYFNDWQVLGEERGFIVAVPHFPKDEFPTSNDYNLGHVFDDHTDKIRPADVWTFAAIEKVFDEVVAKTASERSSYTMFGHSAGSQFVHRYLYYVPDARVDRYLAANAGWYTMPDFKTTYPYGLRRGKRSEEDLARAFGKDMVIMLGSEDIDEADTNLRNTPEAKRQGKNRLERGLTFYAVAKANAEKLGADFNWRVTVVKGASHVNGEMAPAAAGLVE